jgi:hypothetical protein
LAEAETPAYAEKDSTTGSKKQVNIPEAKNQIATPVAEPKVKTVSRTLNITNLLKTDQKTEEKQISAAEKILSEVFTAEQLRAAWDDFASQRKKLQAEFQMLSQPYEVRGNMIVVNLLSPVHETMLANMKSELTAFLREKMNNTSIQVTGELTTTDDKKMIYTNREKFDYLADKNPILKELNDRLGLDTAF